VVCFTLGRSLDPFRVIISCCTSNSELCRSGGIKFVSRFELLTAELLRITIWCDGFALQIGIPTFGRKLGPPSWSIVGIILAGENGTED